MFDGPRGLPRTASTIRRSAIDEQHAPVHARHRARSAIRARAEVVNMRPPDALPDQRGVNELPCIGDGRQSGTSGSPSILNASPEAAVGRWAGAAAHRRPGPHRPEQAAPRTSSSRTTSWRSGAPSSRKLDKRRWPAYVPPTRRHGRRSSAAWSASSPTAWCSKPAVKYRDVARNPGSRLRHNH